MAQRNIPRIAHFVLTLCAVLLVSDAAPKPMYIADKLHQAELAIRGVMRQVDGEVAPSLEPEPSVNPEPTFDFGGIETSSPQPEATALAIVSVSPIPSPVTADKPKEKPADKKEEEVKLLTMPCFPGGATVELEDGHQRRMQELQLGDRVAIGSGRFSEVFLFTHKLGAVRYEFVELEAAHTKVRLTEGHYLSLNGRHAAAGTARVGDTVILGDGRRAAVTDVRRVWASGLYNPQTAAGNIVVDGVVASCYTQAVEPGAAHALLTPLRAAFKRAGIALRALEAGGGKFTAWMPKGRVLL